MKKPIIVLCCAILCIAACSKKNSPAPVTPATNKDTIADTSGHSVDSTTHTTVTHYSGIARMINKYLDAKGNLVVKDTSYPESGVVTIVTRLLDTTITFSSPDSYGKYKGWKSYYSEHTRSSGNVHTLYSDSVRMYSYYSTYGIGKEYFFNGKAQ